MRLKYCYSTTLSNSLVLSILTASETRASVRIVSQIYAAAARAHPLNISEPGALVLSAKAVII
ncbi:hypothetical protein ES703_73579 [subsurface metagenome]